MSCYDRPVRWLVDDDAFHVQPVRAWRRRWRSASRDRRQTDKRGFTTKRDAEAFAASVEVSKLKGEYVAPALGRATVGELAAAWLARKQQATAPSNYRMIESAWRVHVAPRWGRVSVVLSGILADAVKAKRLAVNPAKGIENLPHKSAKRRVYLSSDDVHRLADESGEHGALVLVLAYCGLRWGGGDRLAGERRGVPAKATVSVGERGAARR